MNTNFTKVFSLRSVLLLFVGVGLLIVSLSVFLPDRILAIGGFGSGGSVSQVVTPAVVDIGSSFATPGRPVRLIIPSIGVDTNIQGVGLLPDGAMGIPTNLTDVGWYTKGPLPGMLGSAVIDGHLNGKKVSKGVFYSLQDLKPGDLVEVIDEGGKTLTFKVVSKRMYDYNASTAEVFSPDTSKARLNLITCGGTWMKDQKLYDKRTVVFTELFEEK